MPNISKTVTDAMMRSLEVDYETTPCTMTFDIPLMTLKLKLHVKYLKNGDRYDVGVNRSRTGRHPCAVDWHHHL